MSLAQTSQGTLLKVESGTSAGSYTTIPECTRIGAPNVRFDMIDVTSHDSAGGWREFIPGLLDGENGTADFFWIPANAVHIQLRTDQYAKTKRSFQIVFPGGGTGAQIELDAYVVGLGPQAGVGDVLKNTLTYKMTGEPTWT